MKRLISWSAVLLLGYIGGLVTMAVLAMHAVSPFLQIVRQDYERDQWIMAIEAKRAGDIDEAIVHYSNLVSTAGSASQKSFDKAGRTWSLFFPFAAPILSRIPGAMPQQKGQRINEALYRGLLADALEKSGRASEAHQAYLRASRILGYGDEVRQVRTLVNEALLHEHDLLTDANQ